ncbi:hypothetical protein NEOLEDRAFT_1148357 [Neolentinus lepideus HHB14362 ss-1]|uniref:Uncharacterized protein n=1 Tax=Neolentinus lepideus HHB14362 ss-1 TaxID=1314782 RepID=A0A165S809_9AGAM|nr:hypothetical protein NEOLEDRAFT_1148357 [Neolentinus lepideus HHB14362 ss-1]
MARPSAFLRHGPLHFFRPPPDWLRGDTTLFSHSTTGPSRSWQQLYEIHRAYVRQVIQDSHRWCLTRGGDSRQLGLGPCCSGSATPNHRRPLLSVEVPLPKLQKTAVLPSAPGRHVFPVLSSYLHRVAIVRVVGMMKNPDNPCPLRLHSLTMGEGRFHSFMSLPLANSLSKTSIVPGSVFIRIDLRDRAMLKSKFCLGHTTSRSGKDHFLTNNSRLPSVKLDLGAVPLATTADRDSGVCSMTGKIVGRSLRAKYLKWLEGMQEK